MVVTNSVSIKLPVFSTVWLPWRPLVGGGTGRLLFYLYSNSVCVCVAVCGCMCVCA